MEKKIVVLLLVVGICGPAMASDDNIHLTNLFDENNKDYYWNVASSTERQTLFTELSRDLAIAISHRNMAPGETLGIYGFEIGLDTTVAFVPVGDMCAVDNPIATCQYQNDQKDAWRVMDADHRLTFGNALLLPTLRLRKGLPFSTEAGIDATYLSFSHQGALTGYMRVAPHEGMWEREWRIIPDVAFTAAGTRFVGNEELALSVAEWNLTMGWTVPVGGVRDSYVGTFSPFVGIGVLYITSIPFPDTVVEDNVSTRLLDLTGVTGRKSDVVGEGDGDKLVAMDPTYRPRKINLGFRVTGGRFRLVSGLEISTYDTPDGRFYRSTVSTGFGFIY